MQDSSSVDLSAPRTVHAPERLIAGVRARYRMDNNQGIPAQWAAFDALCPSIPAVHGEVFYGVCSDHGDGSFDYLAGVEVANTAALPPGVDTVTLVAGDYAVFEHRGHIADFQKTIHAIWTQQVPQRQIRLAQAPNFELYDARFDPKTGLGTVEIWLPLA
jgi:AraC family transcriptional regulator